MIAQIIVDVSAYPVDRPFDYKVPASMETLIEAGSRVKVPFGHRDVLGFVVSLSEETEVPLNKIREVSKLIDLEPVLTKEMLKMAKWMTHKTLCYEIDALQVMLPSALRAKYEKNVELLVDVEQLPAELAVHYPANKKSVAYKSFEVANVLVELKRAIKNKQLHLVTKVKQQGRIKSIRKFEVHADIVFLQQQLDELSNRARKQKQAIEALMPFAGTRFLPQQLVDEQQISASVQKALVDLGVAKFVEEEQYRDPFTHDVSKTESLKLTEEQANALEKITSAMDAEQPTTFLLHGVTGSGKTEIYLQAIQNALDAGKESIVLVPEISLTPMMTERFRGRFGELVAVMHSGLSQGEKYDEWRRVQRGEVKVVVGARSAIFAPFTNIGLLILDEEHESTYKQEDTPRYHARDAAIWRGEYYNCPVILGSATPALESFARAKKNVYTLVQLNERAKSQSLPEVKIVDMREELHQGNRSMFSRDLMEAIRTRLERKEQMVLFLNRRGFSSFVLCRDCGTVVQCKNCDISMTYHRSSEKLKCHYCGYDEPVPTECPECKSDHIRFFGTGTQKIETEIFKVFPEARVIRMDVDTTRQKGSHERLLDDFGAGKADILLGTQMIAKGLDFPNITLVGVMSADTSLNLPDFRAAEKTYQLLTQVSGRAGRHDLPGEVIIQSYTPEHYAIELAQAQIFEPFYEQEMKLRRRFSYPPYYFVVVVQVSHEDVMQAAEYAALASDYIRRNLSNQVQVIGPTAASISRIQNRYRYQCLIKYKIEPQLNDVLKQLIKIYRTDWIKKGVQMTVDLDPSSF